MLVTSKNNTIKMKTLGLIIAAKIKSLRACSGIKGIKN